MLLILLLRSPLLVRLSGFRVVILEPKEEIASDLDVVHRALGVDASVDDGVKQRKIRRIDGLCQDGASVVHVRTVHPLICGTDHGPVEAVPNDEFRELDLCCEQRVIARCHKMAPGFGQIPDCPGEQFEDFALNERVLEHVPNLVKDFSWATDLVGYSVRLHAVERCKSDVGCLMNEEAPQQSLVLCHERLAT